MHPGRASACMSGLFGSYVRWLPKTKTAYVPDENSERICGANGKWLGKRTDTVDWNDQKYAEIWRHEWEVPQNNALEAAGCTERIDMRSYERQGITDLEPQIHLGPETAALERKGVPTTRGERNRQIKHVNTLIRSLQKAIAALDEWIKTVSIPYFLLIAPFQPKTFLFPMDKYGTFFTNKE